MDDARRYLAAAHAAMGDWFGRLPGHALRDRGHPRRHRRGHAGGLLLPPGRRRLPARHVLRQHRRPEPQEPVRDGIGRLPRGHPRPPSAAGHRHRAGRGPGLPAPGPRQHRLRRGLGPLRRAPGRRDGPLHRRPRADRDAGRRLLAVLPAGGRHRSARPRLEPPAGHRLHGRQRPGERWGRSRSRSTATSACPARRWPTRSASGRSSGSGKSARRRLGDRFDIRAFHDVVLGSSSVSLPVLRHLVDDWVAV